MAHPDYVEGELVFGRVQGHPPWPAIVIGVAVESSRLELAFYGETQVRFFKNLVNLKINKLLFRLPF